MKQNVTDLTESKNNQKNEPSQDLLNFINVVNSIPLNFKFECVLDSIAFSAVPSGKEVPKLASKMSYLETAYNDWRNIRKSVRQFPLLRDYLKRKVGKIEKCKSSRNRLAASLYVSALLDFEDLREEFIEIVNGLNNEPEMLPHINFAKSSVNLTVVEGKITFQTTDIIRLLEGLESSRLRLCKVCNNIFWAFRRDAQGCSVQCNQTYRTRKWREKNERRFSKENRINGTV